VLRVIGKGDQQRECVIIPRLAAILGDYLERARPDLMARAVSGWLRRYRGRWYLTVTENGRPRERSTGVSHTRGDRRVRARPHPGPGAR